MKTYVCLSYLAVIGLHLRLFCVRYALRPKKLLTIDLFPFTRYRYWSSVCLPLICGDTIGVMYGVKSRVSNTRIYIVHLAIMYEIKIQECYQNECTLRFECITYSFHSDSIVSIRSKRAVRAGRTKHLTHLQFLLCVRTRCSLLQSVYHIVITLV